MNFTKYNEKNHLEIHPAALIMSGLDQAPELEMHILDQALVLFRDGMTKLEQLRSLTSLVKLVNSMMLDLTDRYQEDEAGMDEICIEDTEDGGICVSLGCGKMLTLSPDMAAKLQQCGIAPEMLVDLLLDLMEDEDDT